MAKKNRRGGANRRPTGKRADTGKPTDGEGLAGFLSSPTGLMSVALIAVVVVLLMIFMGGGLARPTAAPPTIAPASQTAVAQAAESITSTISGDALATCNGTPCPSLGSPDAPLTIVEVSDFGCSHCKSFNKDTAPTLISDYVDTGRAQYVSHVFGFYDPSRAVSAAALCAHEQDAYFAFQEIAFADDLALLGMDDIEDAILAAGSPVVPDADAFAACVTEGRYLDEVRLSTDEAMASGVQYTPTIIIGDDVIEGAVTTDEFINRIEQALASQG